MFSPSDYNDAVPQFTNGNYANEPLNPLYVEEPDSVNYKKGAEPLQTLPVQWWNWLWNKITAKLNKLNIYVKNIFNELAGLLSLVNVTPDATEENVTTKQLKNMFATKYPQYLYDSDVFKTNYPKYLNKNFKFESLLQGRTRGVMVAPTDTWNNNTNTLSLTGGFGIIHTYKKVTFSNCNLVIPTDNKVHFIVSNTSGVISIQNSISSNDILIGLCSNKQYCLLIDNNLDQCKDNIILKKWFGQHEISQNFVHELQSYYNTTIASIETNISIETTSNSYSIPEGIYNNCTINIKTVSVGGTGVNSGTCNNCTINIGTITNGNGIDKGTYNNCTITIEKVNGDYGIRGATLNDCNINIGIVDICNGLYNCISDNCTINIEKVKAYGRGINNGTYKNSAITIKTSENYGKCIYYGTYNNCTINIETLDGGIGIRESANNNCIITISKIINKGNGIYNNTTCNNCTITIETVNDGTGIIDDASVVLYYNYIKCSAITSLSFTAGKFNVLNDNVLIKTGVPVDVVEDGNMRAVTSNAVARALEKKRTINPATNIDFSSIENDEVNFYKLSLDTISIEGIKSALITYGFHTIPTGTSIIEFLGSSGQRFTVILSHSSTDYFGGVVITYYFPLTYIKYSNGTWNSGE